MLSPPALSGTARQSHHAFRTLMKAMAQPGTIHAFAPNLDVPAPLGAGTAALLLALSDFETSIWLDPPLRDAAQVAAFLRFHTGSKLVLEPDAADFAVVAAPKAMPRLSGFGQGTLEYPDRSTTVIIQVETLQADGWQLRGPGIRDTNHFSADPLPGDFVAQLNERAFPCGVDLAFVAGTAIAALPRSTRVSEGG